MLPKIHLKSENLHKEKAINLVTHFSLTEIPTRSQKKSTKLEKSFKC
jgi:hypothetical protein